MSYHLPSSDRPQHHYSLFHNILVLREGVPEFIDHRIDQQFHDETREKATDHRGTPLALASPQGAPGLFITSAPVPKDHMMGNNPMEE